MTAPILSTPSQQPQSSQQFIPTYFPNSTLHSTIPNNPPMFAPAMMATSPTSLVHSSYIPIQSFPIPAVMSGLSLQTGIPVNFSNGAQGWHRQEYKQVQVQSPIQQQEFTQGKGKDGDGEEMPKQETSISCTCRKTHCLKL